MSDVVVYQTIL